MSDLSTVQYVLIGLIFVWSGFVRSGLGFGGAVLSLPFLLLVHNDPLVYLPIISVHLLIFATLTIVQSTIAERRASVPAAMGSSAGGISQTNGEAVRPKVTTTVNWRYLKHILAIMIVPKLIGVFGLITLPREVMSAIIFTIVALYSITYILDKPFKSNSKTLDVVFLMLGGYISGTSLIGAPLIIAVVAQHLPREQLRDTLFALWFILVSIKMAAFIYAGVDLQLIQHLWLLPCAAVGHVIGLKFHDRMLASNTGVFFRVIGSALLVISLIGLWQGLVS